MSVAIISFVRCASTISVFSATFVSMCLSPLPCEREEFSERYFVAHAHLQTFVSCERESHAGERENYVIGEIREK